VRCKQAPPVRVSRSGESQRESNWEHAEVAKKRRRDAKERERKCRTEERERERERIIIIMTIIINRERVRDESTMERGKHK